MNGLKLKPRKGNPARRLDEIEEQLDTIAGVLEEVLGNISDETAELMREQMPKTHALLVKKPEPANHE